MTQAMTLNFTPEEFKVLWTAVQQYVDNQPEVDDPSEEAPDVEVAENLRQRLDGMFLDLVQGT